MGFFTGIRITKNLGLGLESGLGRVGVGIKKSWGWRTNQGSEKLGFGLARGRLGVWAVTTVWA